MTGDNTDWWQNLYFPFTTCSMSSFTATESDFKMLVSKSNLNRVRRVSVILFQVEREAQELADNLEVKIFTADIIYHLFDAFMKHREELKLQKQNEFRHLAVSRRLQLSCLVLALSREYFCFSFNGGNCTTLLSLFTFSTTNIKRWVLRII